MAYGSTRRRMLFLSQTLPFPPDGGVQIRTFNVMRLLAREFDITALCFYRRSERRTEQEVLDGLAGLAPFGDIEAFRIPQEHNVGRLAVDHLRSIAARRAYTIFAYHSSSFARRLHELLRTRTFDVVHMDSLDLAGYLPDVHGLPVVCVHHNVESQLLAQRAQHARGAVSWYLDYQARLTEREERRWCNRVALNVVVSEADRRDLAALVPDAPTMVVPNGVDTTVFRPTPQPRRGIVFVGGYSWLPNRDAMEFFARAVLPLLRARGRDEPVTWIGRAPDGVREEYAARHAVELTGYVDDIRPIVDRAACYVVPLRLGGGTRLKILDAWAMGKAVVSTTVGCEGLDARDGRNILIRDSAEAFADAVDEVLRDESLRDRLAAGARATAESTYEWEVIGATMLPAYRAVLDDSP